MRTSYYADAIRAELVKLGTPDADPRHVEAYIRLEHPTLNGLSRRRFAQEVSIGLDCLAADGPDHAERLAQSFGL